MLGYCSQEMRIWYGCRQKLHEVADPDCIPKGSCVGPLWVCYGFLARDFNILPTKELHRRVWVEANINLHLPPIDGMKAAVAVLRG